jgi:ribosomal protein S18 acetylase RimI-like enzyme
MAIRRANEMETENILAHSFPVMKEATMGRVKESKEMTFNRMKQFVAQGGYYLIDTDEDKVKGWLAIGEYDDGYSKKRIGFFLELYVYPKFRKEGIAKALLKAGIDEMKEKQLERIQLNVYAGNLAKELYDELGFYDVSTLMEKRIN